MYSHTEGAEVVRMPQVTRVHVHPSNVAQARAWDGDEGAYWARHARQFEESTARYDPRFLEAAAITAGSRVLDVGCGTGGTTRKAARLASSGTALGVDLSARMIEVARRLAERADIANARFEQGDVQIYPFEESSIDVVISRTGAMFFGDPVAAFSNLARALHPAGRVVLLVWQELDQNEWISEISAALAAGRERPSPPPDAPGPFSMADPDRVRSVLTHAGFATATFDSLYEPMYFGRDAEAAFELVAGLTAWMLDGLDDAGRARALDNLRATMAAQLSVFWVLFGSEDLLISCIWF
jgi:SAM-dependent methyltransferase